MTRLPWAPVHPDVDELGRSVAGILDRGLGEVEAVEAMRAPLARFLEVADDVLTDDEVAPWEGDQASGHLLFADPGRRFHIMTVVFPPGTSSGIHEHGCWGVIGYLRGLDEETKYRRVDGADGEEGVELEELDRRINQPGEITRLLPPDEMFHRVRNPGDVDGVSIHVLCNLPDDHPHRFWDRDTKRLLPFPFRTLDRGVVRAEVVFDR